MFNGYLSLCYILTKCAYVCVHVCVCVCMCAGSSLLHRIFSSCCELGLLFIVIQGLLIAVASLVEHGLQALRLQQSHWLSCCNFQAPELGSVVVVHGLIASQHVGSSWARNRSNLHLLQWHADSHPLCQQGSPLCVHIFNVPNCIAFSCLPLALSKVATGLHRYSLYHLSICAPRERHRLMTFAHRIMLQNPHACSLRDWSDISSSFIPRNGTSGP